jgi:protein required for attachment to host cells
VAVRIRIVVANQGEAAFFDQDSNRGTLRFEGRLADPQAHLHDRDFKSDRPGRVYDHAPRPDGRRGATAHHSTGGERRPKKHEAAVFARRISGQLEHAWRNGEFDRLVVMAAPAFLGLLRKAMPESLRTQVAAEVTKDLVHELPDAVQAHIPPEAFHELSGSP